MNLSNYSFNLSQLDYNAPATMIIEPVKQLPMTPTLWVVWVIMIIVATWGGLWFAKHLEVKKEE